MRCKLRSACEPMHSAQRIHAAQEVNGPLRAISARRECKLCKRRVARFAQSMRAETASCATHIAQRYCAEASTCGGTLPRDCAKTLCTASAHGPALCMGLLCTWALSLRPWTHLLHSCCNRVRLLARWPRGSPNHTWALGPKASKTPMPNGNGAKVQRASQIAAAVQAQLQL